MVKPMTTRVFLLDDHEVVRVGLATMLDGEPVMRYFSAIDA